MHLYLPTIGPIMLVSKASTRHFPLLHWHITGLSNLALEVGVVPKALEVGLHCTNLFKATEMLERKHRRLSLHYP